MYNKSFHLSLVLFIALQAPVIEHSGTLYRESSACLLPKPFRLVAKPGYVPSAALDKLGFEPVDTVHTIVVPSISSLIGSTGHTGDAEHSLYKHKPGSSFWYSDHSRLYQR